MFAHPAEIVNFWELVTVPAKLPTVPPAIEETLSEKLAESHVVTALEGIASA